MALLELEPGTEPMEESHPHTPAQPRHIMASGSNAQYTGLDQSVTAIPQLLGTG